MHIITFQANLKRQGNTHRASAESDKEIDLFASRCCCCCSSCCCSFCCCSFERESFVHIPKYTHTRLITSNNQRNELDAAIFKTICHSHAHQPHKRIHIFICGAVISKLCAMQTTKTSIIAS